MVGQLDGVPARQRPHGLGQIFVRWHTGALDQHRNHPNAAIERRFDFHPDEIVFVV